MGKREKVLLALMAVAISYGAFELFYSPPARDPVTQDTVNVGEVQEMSAAISRSLQESELDEEESYVLQAAAARWEKNPFHIWPDPGDEVMVEIDEEIEPDLIHETLAYSGYLEMGGTRLAVINNTEYRKGEKLEQGNLTVLNIAPGSVTLRSEINGQEYTIPYDYTIYVD